MDRQETSALLKQWALEEGFDDAGVAALGPMEHGEVFLRWLRRGQQAGMEYLERRVEARLDPSQLFPEARSALCVALQYSPLGSESGEVGGDLWPRVARYARGQDYHHLMGDGLERLAQRIAGAFPGTRTRRYVDTGPVLERELAARAGLGCVGKNTNLLHPEGGSWFLLGELILSLDLSPDLPLADMCGTCTRCLEACPTGALPEPYHLDSNRCISYWTIEHRGPMPEAVRGMVGDWVFGCDICQEVCPWNDAPREASHPGLRLEPRRAELDLVSLLALGRDEYLERFRGSAMKRAKQEGLQRNAAVAMGNRRDPRYVPVLVRALDSDFSVVRGQAAWALGKIGGEQAKQALQRAGAREEEAQVRREIDSALRSMTNSRVRGG